MIEITGLTQSYRNKVILQDIHLMIQPNEICALVGRNGAGKSTLIHSMLNLLPIKRGTVLLGGISHARQEWKKDVAYLPEKFLLYPHLSGEENMTFFASLGTGPIDEKKIEEILRKVNLWEQRADLIKGYSKGMLQRLGLGIMLYYDTNILILDEPTSGLDPMGRIEILKILKSLENKTILFSSHHMDEIKQICTHVAYLEEGIIQKYSIEEFTRQFTMGGS